VDNHTVLDHAKPHGDSRELYKSILAGNSRTVFNGRIVVREHAQKTDAKQSSRNLLLSKGALAHARPQLEIYANDVKCTHGATIGRLDESAIFYLRTRGLTDAQARNLLIAAFAGEVLERIDIEVLRSHLERAVADRLRQAVG
jgi:Fe-S cluster assembly protein SufD